MGSKTVYRTLLYLLSEATFGFFMLLLRVLPLRVFAFVATPMLRLLIFFVIPRGRVMKNMRAAFGQAYSESTKRGLARGVQEHFVRNLLDCYVQIRYPEETRRIITVKGLENLNAALAKGRGVIALGAHIGNFVLVGTRLGMEGYPVSTLFRLPASPRIRKLIQRYLPRFHQQVIPSLPKRLAVRRILDALKRNEVVFVLGDNLKKGKIETLLFGQRVPSPRGPVSLALRSGAPVVPLYLVRNYQGGLHLVIEPEMVMARNGNLSEDIAANTRQLVRYLEVLIRTYPDQWNWLTVRMKRSLSHPGARAA